MNEMITRALTEMERRTNRGRGGETGEGRGAEVMAHKHPKNHERVERAALALAELYGDEPRADVTDLLTDLRHYCSDREVDFEQCLRLSETHYQACFHCLVEPRAMSQGSRAAMACP